MNENVIKNLTLLGFSDKEAKVYLALLKHKEAFAGLMVKDTRLHRQLVYNALDSLEGKGLVKKRSSRGKIVFQAADPGKLSDLEKERGYILRETLREVNGLYSVPSQDITIYEGKEGFISGLRDIMEMSPPNDTHLIIGAAGKVWYEITAGYYNKYFKEMKNKNITIKSIASLSQQKELEQVASQYLGKYFQTRALPEEFPAPSSTVVFFGGIFIQILIGVPTIILIKNKAVEMAYRNYFNVMWKMAKKRDKK